MNELFIKSQHIHNEPSTATTFRLECTKCLCVRFAICRTNNTDKILYYICLNCTHIIRTQTHVNSLYEVDCAEQGKDNIDILNIKRNLVERFKPQEVEYILSNSILKMKNVDNIQFESMYNKLRFFCPKCKNCQFCITARHKINKTHIFVCVKCTKRICTDIQIPTMKDCTHAIKQLDFIKQESM